MKLAVLSGINLYQHYPDESLRGCGTDMRNLRLFLVNEIGFQPKDIFMLQDSQAKAAAEKKAVLEAISRAKDGDHIFWGHSSHGSNNPDPSQKDGLQELLCCYDLQEKGGLWVEDTCITAKWIGEAIAELHPGVTMDIILDCCNAPEGSQLKSIGRRYDRARFLPRSIVGTPVKPLAMKIIQAGIPANVCLWSACEPHQTSADAYIDKRWQGAFCASFLRAYKAGRSRSDIIHYTRKWLKDNRYSQRPHLYCKPEMATRKLGGE